MPSLLNRIAFSDRVIALVFIAFIGCFVAVVWSELHLLCPWIVR
jgi:hypothetical protein